MKLLSRCSSFDVMEGETVCATELLDDLDDSMEQIAEWKSRCHQREAAVLRLTEKLREHCRGSATPASTESQPHCETSHWSMLDSL